jgi:hypothetical protein
MKILTLKIRLIIAAISALVVALGALMGVTFMVAGAANYRATASVSTVSQCGVTPIMDAAPGGSTSEQQIKNAKAIDQTAAKLGLSGQASRIAIITALGESSLINIGFGDAGNGVVNPDGSPTTSFGLFQQQTSQGWGTKEQVMDPEYATTSFLIGKKHDRKGGLISVSGWEKMSPTAAIHTVQGNADPNYYAQFYSQADQIMSQAGIDVNRAAKGDSDGGTENASDTSGSDACSVGTDAQSLAQGLVADMSSGKLTQLVGYGDILGQIKNIAEGKSVENCGVDTRVLQIITVATRTFPTVQLSSINRKCTNVVAGAGTNSAHWVNGGGHAVDFSGLNGKSTTGADANALTLLRALDPLMPAGSGAGQIECRAAAGTTIELPHMTQFRDSCNHLHVQVDPYSQTPMTIPTS